MGQMISYYWYSEEPEEDVTVETAKEDIGAMKVKIRRAREENKVKEKRLLRRYEMKSIGALKEFKKVLEVRKNEECLKVEQDLQIQGATVEEADLKCRESKKKYLQVFHGRHREPGIANALAMAREEYENDKLNFTMTDLKKQLETETAIGVLLTEFLDEM